MIDRAIFKEYERGIVVKAIDYICSIDNADFCRDYGKLDAISILKALQAGTLRIKGMEYADVAQMDAQGNITISKIQ